MLEVSILSLSTIFILGFGTVLTVRYFFLQFIKLEAQWAEPVSLTFHSALGKLYTQTSIGDSYQISVHLATRFQRRRFFRNNKKKELPIVAMFDKRSGRNEQWL